jgi:hypothetical protein
MGRALTVHRATVPAKDRSRYLERLKVRAAHYHSARCRFWVFEEAALSGAFIEFMEADDEPTLSRAHASAPDQVLSVFKIYQQVEID